jgi:hypothetical protein
MDIFLADFCADMTIMCDKIHYGGEIFALLEDNERMLTAGS